jgi:hypothetical protein
MVDAEQRTMETGELDVVWLGVEEGAMASSALNGDLGLSEGGGRGGGGLTFRKSRGWH